MSDRLRRAAMAAALVALMACAPRAPIPDAPASGHPPGFDPAAAGALADAGWIVCPIDPSASLLDVRVVPAGALARLGHHHVITTRKIGGHVAARGGELQADLFVAATDFVVDDPARRQAAGPPFDDEIPPDDRAGTRANLLGPEVLAAGEHPWLRISAGAFDARRAGPAPSAIVRIAGATVVRPLGVDRFDAGRISGGFELTHETLGLEPFTALGGSLRVGDPIDVRYVLTLDASRDPACAELSAPPLTR